MSPAWLIDNVRKCVGFSVSACSDLSLVPGSTALWQWVQWVARSSNLGTYHSIFSQKTFGSNAGHRILRLKWAKRVHMVQYSSYHDQLCIFRSLGYWSLFVSAKSASFSCMR